MDILRLAPYAVLAALTGCGSSASTPSPTADSGPPGVDADTRPDSDGDGLKDEDEVNIHGTDPNDPDSDGDGLGDGDEIDLGTDPNDGDSDDDGIPDGEEVEIGSDPNDPDDIGCAGDSAAATVLTRPVDVVVVIDTSSSMDFESDAVEDNVNDTLSQTLSANNVDHKVILIADHPAVPSGDGQTHASFSYLSASDPTLCVDPPLANDTNNDCGDNDDMTLQDRSNAPATPGNNASFVHYEPQPPPDSTDSLERLITEFDNEDDGALDDAFGDTDGWGDALRTDSIKVFVIVTDDEQASRKGDGTDLKARTFTPCVPGVDASCDATSFVVALQNKYSTLTGETLPVEDITIHSIIGIAEKGNGGAYGPNEPVVGAKCSSADDHEEDYENLSKKTGGLRFPVCATDYQAIFDDIAAETISGAQLPCSYSAEGMGADPTKAVVIYKPGDGSPSEALTQVGNAADCVDGGYTQDGFDFELCPDTCDRISSDELGEVTVALGCNKGGVD